MERDCATCLLSLEESHQHTTPSSMPMTLPILVSHVSYLSVSSPLLLIESRQALFHTQKQAEIDGFCQPHLASLWWVLFVQILMMFKQLLEQTSPNLHTPTLYQDLVLNKITRNPFEMSNFFETSWMRLTSLPCLSGVKFRITCPLKANVITQLDLKVLEP